MAEEVKKLTGEDITTPEMLAAEINKAFAKYNNLLSSTATAAQVKQMQADMIVENKELLTKITSSGDQMDLQKKELEKLTDTIKVQGEQIVLLKSFSTGTGTKESFQDVVRKELDKGIFNDIADERTSKAKFEVKTTDLAFTGTYGSGAAQQSYMPFQVPQYPPMENFDVRLILPTGTIDSAKLEYPQEYTTALDNQFASKAENAVGVQSTIQFTMATANAVRITSFVNVSRRALKNTAWLSQYISSRLMSLFVKTLNTQALVGAGAGTDLVGINHDANSFAGTGFANMIADANYMDVLNCAKGEMMNSYFITPNTVLLNPVDATILASTKNTIADFINPGSFLSSNNSMYTSIFGMRPIASADIPTGDYLIAAIDPSYMQLLFNGPIEVLATDSHDTNFIKNLVTIKLEADVMLPIYNINSLLKGDLATDLGTITKI